MVVNAHEITRNFETALCEYTGARYAVAVTSCTAALFLSLKWCDITGDEVEIPRFTYVSVPMQIRHAGGVPIFRDDDWQGEYRLGDTPVWDAARRFTSGMYVPGRFQCVSFHWSKVLGLSQAGAILHDHPEADAWFRRARFDGRSEGVAPKDDDFNMLGWHCYLSPEVAAHGLMKLATLPKHNADLLRSDYPDLSLIDWSAMR